MFLTGQGEIEKACAKLNEAVTALPPGSCRDLLVLPIYAAMPPEMQVCFRIRRVRRAQFAQFDSISQLPPRLLPGPAGTIYSAAMQAVLLIC